MISYFEQRLLGKDLRSIGRSDEVVRLVQDQTDFDELFKLLLHHERLLVMRAADAIEKITATRKQFLEPHKDQILILARSAMDKGLKWHIAQLISRIPLSTPELKEVSDLLVYWAKNPNESKIVRVNALQGLYELSLQFPDLKDRLEDTISILEHEPIPSLKARIRKLRR
ncbi:MAG: hypothetical protein ABIR06_21535 [Cyclobacteriaceae bacterium]